MKIEKRQAPLLQEPEKQKQKKQQTHKTRAQKVIEQYTGGMPADSLSVIAQRELLLEEARKFNLFSNVFLSLVLKDSAACQHVLRILLGKKDLTLQEVRTQYSVTMVLSHDAYLDVFAEDTQKVIYNLELQRADTADHGRRIRFYSSMLDSEFLQKGKAYAELPDMYMIYISETDIWKQGKTVLRVRQYLEEPGKTYDDGRYVIYVNAAIDDGSEIAALMRYFKTADPEDRSQGALSERVHFLKREEAGGIIMCEVTDRLIEMGKQWGIEEGIKQGIQQGIQQGREQGIQQGLRKNRQIIARNLLQLGVSAELAAQALEVDVALVRKWGKGRPAVHTKNAPVKRRRTPGRSGRGPTRGVRQTDAPG